MKKYLIYLAVLAVVFSACENNTPFDAQNENDAPIILRPYDESGSGSYNYSRNSDQPLVDSVVVIPSSYTTVNWYVDGELVFTGNKIDMYFPVGKYSLRIEAVTTAGKKTYRDGSLTVNPIASDPYSAPEGGGRFASPSRTIILNGQNLSMVEEVQLTKGVIYEAKALYTMTPTAKADDQLTIILPDKMDNGKYYVRFKAADGKMYGSDAMQITDQALVLSGYSMFIPTQEWTLTDINLQNVAKVKIGETTVNEVTATETSVTFTAPAMELGDYPLSMANKEGSAVLFQTADGIVEQVTATAQEEIIIETTLWEGPEYIIWNENRVRIESADMEHVPAGATIFIYFEKLPEGHEGYYDNGEYKEYQKMKVMTAWWTDLFPEFDVNDATPNPYTFEYTADMKSTVEAQNAMSIAGWGLFINKITYKK